MDTLSLIWCRHPSIDGQQVPNSYDNTLQVPWESTDWALLSSAEAVSVESGLTPISMKLSTVHLRCLQRLTCLSKDFTCLYILKQVPHRTTYSAWCNSLWATMSHILFVTWGHWSHRCRAVCFSLCLPIAWSLYALRLVNIAGQCRQRPIYPLGRMSGAPTITHNFQLYLKEPGFWNDSRALSLI